MPGAVGVNRHCAAKEAGRRAARLVHQLQRRDEVTTRPQHAGQLPVAIRLARLAITGWMIVSGDDCGRVVMQGAFEDFPWVNGRAIHRARRVSRASAAR